MALGDMRARYRAWPGMYVPELREQPKEGGVKARAALNSTETRLGRNPGVPSTS